MNITYLSLFSQIFILFPMIVKLSRGYKTTFFNISPKFLSIKFLSSKNPEINVNKSPMRVRFAPSPTGSLHIGGARTALFNWLLARQSGGSFILRVEDTDLSRSTKESENSILEDMRWLKLDWDEGPDIGGSFGPYRQSERIDIYKSYAQKLLDEGKAYRCFCTEKELEEKRVFAENNGLPARYDGTWREADPKEIEKRLMKGDPYTIRFKIPENKIVSVNDCVRGKVQWDVNAVLGDFIILRSNGMPVYNFCVSVDDAAMKISHVLRADEHLSNTLRQLLILEALDHPAPIYAHCSLILGQDKSKLSKRHGATSVKQFKESGFLPEAMLNYLVNLGWSEGIDKDIYKIDELIKSFSIHRITKGAAVFDIDKLKWVNSQHVKMKSHEDMEKIVLDEISKIGPNQLIDKIILNDSQRNNPIFKSFLNISTKIAQRDMVLTTDANNLINNCLVYHFEDTIKYNKDEIDKLPMSTVIEALVKDYESGIIPKGSEENFHEVWKKYLKDLGKRLNLKGKNLFHPIRIALTGSMHGPDVGDQIMLINSAKDFLLPSVDIKFLEDRISVLKIFLKNLS